jgi:CheY-like chemotaxis protein
MTLRCVIVDDSLAFVAAARSLLEDEGITVVGVATNGPMPYGWPRTCAPTSSWSTSISEVSGPELARRLASSAGPAPPVILISSRAEEDYLDLVADSPAVGFLPKLALSAVAIRRLLDDRTDVPPGPVTGPAEP